MADDAPPLRAAPIARNDLVVAAVLAGCIGAVAVLAGLSWVGAPAQWDIIDKVVDGLLVIITTLTGSVIVKSKG